MKKLVKVDYSAPSSTFEGSTSCVPEMPPLMNLLSIQMQPEEGLRTCLSQVVRLLMVGDSQEMFQKVTSAMTFKNGYDCIQ